MAPRKAEQFEALREKSREKILAASLELFANKGYDATSIDSIAKKAGISKGLVYNYFDSKKSILLAIFGDAMKIGEDIMEAQKKVKNTVQRKRTVIEMTFDMIKNQPEYVKLLTVMALQQGVMSETKDFIQNAYKKTGEWSKVMTGTEKKDGLIETLMLGALMDGITLNFIMYGDQYPLEELKKEIIKTYCAPEKGKKKR